jgi:hypothetical protein
VGGHIGYVGLGAILFFMVGSQEAEISGWKKGLKRMHGIKGIGLGCSG